MTTMSTKAFEDRKPDTFFRRSLGVLALVAVLSFVVFVLRPLRSIKGPFSFGPNEASAIGSSVEAGAFRYRCDQASEDAREAIDYYADPCEDFHAYACHPTRGRDRGQVEEERKTLQRVLLELSSRNDREHVATQAAMLLKSCLGTPLSLEVLLQKNMLEFLNITNLTMEYTFAVTVRVEILKRIFTILFDKLNPREAAIYSMAHVLLPSELLEVLLDDNRNDACFRLIADTLGTSWQYLESYLLGFFDENHEEQSVADSLLSTLEKMLRENYAPDKEKSGAAIAKLKQLRFDVLSMEGLASNLQDTACRGNLSDRSLYRNVLLCRGSSHNVRTAKNDATRRRERSSLSTTTILLPVESFRPSSFCHGHDNPLNYATFGTDLAATLLRYVSEPLGGAASPTSEAGRRETLIPALTTNISACLAKTSTRRPLGKVLEDIASQTVAFQVALQASKSHASVWTRLENAADAPAWKQTYFVKYCQRLCSKGASHSFTAALDAVLVCNLVVMNTPEFAQLFTCEHGDPMVPAEYCLAL
ncbi:hypothetical protein HPB49_021287 [Dermacentor silvarum]|uniref:Uncharacterized protein n=1 Tax=Dermacentor silvarum TaxID=543639 RepID=A0ACB8CT84_DERSI|nr:hypothetical protein HPB49_021287 [Dermacentor silvarum]